MGNLKDKNKKSHQNRDQDYDVKKNLRQISPYQSHRSINRYQTGTGEKQYSSPSTLMSNSPDLYGATGSAYSEYIRLDDKLADYSAKNEDAHQSLRKEFEGKIERYEEKIEHKIEGLNDSIGGCVSASWFKWILGGLLTALVVICTIWYNLSYAPTLDKVEKIQDKINSIEDQQVNTNKIATSRTHLK